MPPSSTVFSFRTGLSCGAIMMRYMCSHGVAGPAIGLSKYGDNVVEKGASSGLIPLKSSASSEESLR